MDLEHARQASSPTLDSKLLECYRAASPTQKLAVVGRINAALTAMKDADLARCHPDWTPAQRTAAVRLWWLQARD